MLNKNLLLIVNPCSGKGKMKSNLFSVVDVFSKAGFEVTVYITKERADATKKVETLKTGDYSLIVACGGDGTLNEVITGLMNGGIDCPIGYIPAGTLNEWSTGLGIPKIIKKAAEGIADGEEISLDIGKFGDKYFTYTASFGAFTSASYSAPQNVKNVLGQSAYFFEGIKSLASIKPIRLRVECEDKTFEDEYLFGAVSNSMSLGGVLKFDKNTVELNDGLFEVLLIKKPGNLLKLQPMLDGILKHDLNREGMEFFHAKSIKIFDGEDMDWTLDGEHAIGEKVTEIENIHNAVRFIVPKQKQKKNKK